MKNEHRVSSVLVKPVSADCNLACDYCFYCGRPGDPYRYEKRHLMSDDVLEALVNQMMSLCPEHAVFVWQGGEPLLAGIEFYRKAVQYQMQHGRDGQLVSNNIMTNGILLNDEWTEFFGEYRVF